MLSISCHGIYVFSVLQVQDKSHPTRVSSNNKRTLYCKYTRQVRETEMVIEGAEVVVVVVLVVVRLLIRLNFFQSDKRLRYLVHHHRLSLYKNIV